MDPRPYQHRVIDAVFDSWQEHGGDPVLISMCTGGGKTICFSHTLKRLYENSPGVRTLLLAHRKELISQAEKKMLQVWPEAPSGVYAASLKRREICPITVASRDSIVGFIESQPMAKFHLVIVDECHNISHKEDTRYRKMLRALSDRYPTLMLIGYTATPFRSNHGVIYGEGELFPRLNVEVRIRELLDLGFLAPLVPKRLDPYSMVDTSGIKMVGGEFHQGQLAAASMDERLIDAMLKEWREHAVDKGRKHTLFFCVSVAHAEMVQTALGMIGYDIPLVTGKTSDEDRDRINEEFLAGKHIGLLNVGVYTEGTDFPLIDCICNMRAVHSLGLWLQMAGRGMRIDEGKTDCLVLDFGGCIDRFGPIDIAMPPAKRGKPDNRTKDCPECETVVGFYKRKCPTCNFEFIPPPFKECAQCGEENAPSATRCSACGKLFADHEREASTGEILSTNNPLQVVRITGPLRTMGMIANGTGLPYVKVLYPTSLTKFESKILCVGREGVAGAMALNEWRMMTIPGTPDPADCEEACRMVDRFRPVESVSLKRNGKYTEIVAVEYKEEQAA